MSHTTAHARPISEIVGGGIAHLRSHCGAGPTRGSLLRAGEKWRGGEETAVGRLALPESHPMLRARRQAHGIGLLCRKFWLPLSDQNELTVHTICAERKHSRLSAQIEAHDTEALWREPHKQALDTAGS
jgi:hypothetical protein